jgi:hypothetical protein
MRDCNLRKAQSKAAMMTSTKTKLPIIRNRSALPNPGAMAYSFLKD